MRWWLLVTVPPPIRATCAPRLRSICLVLVEAIRRGEPTPFAQPELFGADGNGWRPTAEVERVPWPSIAAGQRAVCRRAGRPAARGRAVGWGALLVFGCRSREPYTGVPHGRSARRLPGSDQGPLHPEVGFCRLTGTTGLDPTVDCWRTVVNGVNVSRVDQAVQLLCLRRSGCIRRTTWIQNHASGGLDRSTSSSRTWASTPRLGHVNRSCCTVTEIMITDPHVPRHRKGFRPVHAMKRIG